MKEVGWQISGLTNRNHISKVKYFGDSFYRYKGTSNEKRETEYVFAKKSLKYQKY